MTTKVELNFGEWFGLSEYRRLGYKRLPPTVDRSVDTWIDAVEKLKDDIHKLKDELGKRDREEKLRPKAKPDKKSPTKVPVKKKDEEPDDEADDDDDLPSAGVDDRGRVGGGRLPKPEVPRDGGRGRKPTGPPDPPKDRKRRKLPDGV